MSQQQVMIATNECKKSNAFGVQNLLNGKLNLAINNFTHALALTKHLLSQYDTLIGPDDHPSSPSDSSLEMDVDDDQHQYSSVPSSLSTSCDHEVTTRASRVPGHHYEQDTMALSSHHHHGSTNLERGEERRCTNGTCWGQYVYKNPLEIEKSADLSSYEAKVELSIAIMFNLALSHHLNALSAFTKEQHDMWLHHALSLYELAYTIQMQEDSEVSVECTMATINNLGQVHYALGNTEKASRCFNHLLSTIVFVQQDSYYYNSSHEDNDDTTTKQQSEVFVRSVSHLILKDIVAPAA